MPVFTTSLQTCGVCGINSRMRNATTSIRHFFANVVCAFIYDDLCRKKVRAIINSPYLSWRRFVRRDCGVRHPKIKLLTGFSGRNLLFRVDDKYIYKFIHKTIKGTEQREYDIASALAPISPIPLMVPTLLNTPTGPVRRYDFAPGMTLREFAEKYPEKYSQNKESLADQIANFMYEMARHDPVQIRKHKRGYTPKNIKLKRPGYMYGWYHGDIGDNFMINPDTLRVTAIIDLESISYGDFSKDWVWEACPLVHDFITCVKQHYDKIWNARHKKSAK